MRELSPDPIDTMVTIYMVQIDASRFRLRSTNALSYLACLESPLPTLLLSRSPALPTCGPPCPSSSMLAYCVMASTLPLSADRNHNALRVRGAYS